MGLPQQSAVGLELCSVNIVCSTSSHPQGKGPTINETVWHWLKASQINLTRKHLPFSIQQTEYETSVQRTPNPDLLTCCFLKCTESKQNQDRRRSTGPPVHTLFLSVNVLWKGSDGCVYWRRSLHVKLAYPTCILARPPCLPHGRVNQTPREHHPVLKKSLKRRRRRNNKKYFQRERKKIVVIHYPILWLRFFTEYTTKFWILKHTLY